TMSNRLRTTLRRSGACWTSKRKLPSHRRRKQSIMAMPRVSGTISTASTRTAFSRTGGGSISSSLSSRLPSERMHLRCVSLSSAAVRGTPSFPCLRPTRIPAWSCSRATILQKRYRWSRTRLCTRTRTRLDRARPPCGISPLRLHRKKERSLRPICLTASSRTAWTAWCSSLCCLRSGRRSGPRRRATSRRCSSRAGWCCSATMGGMTCRSCASRRTACWKTTSM
ncbi:hypothetical protein OC835_008066, partial [Tilletia horrida]